MKLFSPLAALIFTIVLFGCNSEDKNKGGLLDNTSVYDSTSIWQNQSGKEVRLNQFEGKVQVVAMVFTKCPMVCPRLVADMVILDDSVKNKSGVNYILLSMDDELDTPEVLNDFAQLHELDLSRWTLLHGESSNIRTMANRLGVEYTKYKAGSFSHSNLITILDKSGKVVSQIEGLESDQTEALTVLNDLLN
ncbi:MAG: SCO family protein [Flavobacteriales bacterium]|nr:SCO family protein [Flavobacteriales bacterium]